MDSRKLYPKHFSSGMNCPHCGQKNPAKAFACIHCYKTLRESGKETFWSLAARPSYSALGMALLLFLGVGAVLKGWLATVEAKMTINVKTAQYDVSLIADKRKKQAEIEVKHNEDEGSVASASKPEQDLDFDK